MKVKSCFAIALFLIASGAARGAESIRRGFVAVLISTFTTEEDQR
jgi:hypothetical protein